MKFRNARKISGGIELEVRHDKLGWIPCVARARDDSTWPLYQEARQWLEQRRRW